MRLPNSRQCKNCGLIFLPEEELRYDTHMSWCVRCIVVRDAAENRIKPLPNCFGRSYNGAMLECVRLCKVSQACIIQTGETRSIEWSLDIERIRRKGTFRTGGTVISYAVRLLKAMGRPMHLRDIAPLLKKTSGGKFDLYAERTAWTAACRWQSTLRGWLSRNCDVVTLGDDFFVWLGAWNPLMGGNVGHRPSQEETTKLTPVKTIVKKLKEQEPPPSITPVRESLKSLAFLQKEDDANDFNNK